MTDAATGAPSSVAVMVAPADGVAVLRETFASLKGAFPGTIVILVNAGTGAERGIADNLNVSPRVMFHPAVAGVSLRDGHAYVVPAGARLAVGADGVLIDAEGETLLGSVARRCGAASLAVALTALDDAERAGFARVRAAGGTTIALDERDRLWADSRGPRVVPDPADELLAIPELGPRMILAAGRAPALR